MLHHLFHHFLLAPVSRRLWLTLVLLGSLPTADLWAQASLDSPGLGSGRMTSCHPGPSGAVSGGPEA